MLGHLLLEGLLLTLQSQRLGFSVVQGLNVVLDPHAVAESRGFSSGPPLPHLSLHQERGAHSSAGCYEKRSRRKGGGLTNGHEALGSEEIVDPVVCGLDEVPRDGHRRLVCCSCLSGASDEVLDVLCMEGAQDGPEEFPIHASAALPFVGEVLGDPRDSDGIGPDGLDGELRPDRDLEVLRIRLIQESLPTSEDLLDEMEGAVGR